MAMTRPRLAHVLLSVFALLVVGAIALSLSSAPPVDSQQLSLAAKATMTASGFVLVDTNSVTVLGPVPGGAGGRAPSRTVVIRVLYQAPDRVQESEAGPTGGAVSVIVLGSERFRSNGSQWTALPPQPGLGAQAARTITSPLQVAASAPTVTRQGTGYQFVPRRLDQFLVTILGVRRSQLTAPRLSAVVHGDYLTDEKITAVLGRQRLGVDLAFSAIGSAPPVQAPPATSLVPSAGSSVPAP